MNVLNWGVIRQPMNWVTVLLMLIIAGTAVHLILTHYSKNMLPSSSES